MQRSKYTPGTPSLFPL